MNGEGGKKDAQLMGALTSNSILKRLRYRAEELLENLSSIIKNNSKEPPHKLVVEGYKGYNILKCEDKFYAIAQTEGAFSLRKYKKGGYSKCFEADSLEEAKRLAEENEIEINIPVLLEEGVKGFNIIQYKDHLYAIPQSEGAFDEQRLSAGGYTMVLKAEDIEELKAIIDRKIEEGGEKLKELLRFTEPRLETSLHGYNIVSYGGKYIGIPQYIGEVRAEDMESTDVVENQIIGETLEEVKQAIEAIVRRKAVPRLVKEDYRGFNIVEFCGYYYGLAQEEGAFDIDKYDRGEYKRVVKAESLWQVKRLIKQGVMSIISEGAEEGQ